MKMVRETLVTMGCHQAGKAVSLIHSDSVQEFRCLFHDILPVTNSLSVPNNPDTPHLSGLGCAKLS